MKKISITQTVRIVVQLVFFFLLPELFILTFNALKQSYDLLLRSSMSIQTFFPLVSEAIAVIAITIIFGRFFCGWICAFGTLNDLMYKLTHKFTKKKITVNQKLDTILKSLKYVFLGISVVYLWNLKTNIFMSYSPWDAFGQALRLPEALSRYLGGFIILATIMLGAMFIERFFCRYLCPLGAFFVIISKLRIFKINKPTKDCNKCKLCTEKCAMGINLSKTEKVNSGECIFCMNCALVCPRNNAKVAINKATLNPLVAGTIAVTTFTGAYAANSKIADSLSNSIVIKNSDAIVESSIAPTSIPAERVISNGINSKGAVNNKTTENSEEENKEAGTPQTNVIKEEAYNKNTAFAEAKTVATRKTITRATAKPITKATIKPTFKPTQKPVVKATVKPIKKVITNTATPKPTAKPTAKPTVKPATVKNSVYKDGVYTGSAFGFRPNLGVAVTIKNDKITNIEITSSNETPRYAQYPFQIIPEEIIAAQSTSVDAVSGATMSSMGIMNAVDEALSKAKN